MRECSKCKRCFDDSVVLCPDHGSDTQLTIEGTPLIAGRYRLTNFVGDNTLGRLYIAQDESLAGREVALRIIMSPRLDSASWNRLAARLASVQDQNVVEVTDFGVGSPGSYFVVSERMTAPTLNSLIRRAGKLKLPRAIGLLRQIASGVEAIHATGLLHGALNPDNAFVDSKFTTLGEHAEEEFVKISDFGWGEVRTINSVAEASTDSATPIAGEIEFLAPEQVQPGLPVDHRIDAYGLGALAFYLLSGRPPFTGDLMQVVVQKTMGEPQSLKKLCPELPESITELVAIALSRDVASRPGSIGEWMSKIETAVERASADLGAERPPEVMVVAPAGTTVILDDEVQGTVPANGEFSLLMVQLGVHMVRVVFPDDTDAERLLEITSTAESATVRVVFERPVSQDQSAVAPAAPSIGSNDGMPLAAAGLGQEGGPANGATPMVEMGSIYEPAAQEAGTVLSTPIIDASNKAAAPEAERMNCEKCGGDIRSTSKFCRICGAPVSKAPASPIDVPQPLVSQDSAPAFDSAHSPIAADASAAPDAEVATQVLSGLPPSEPIPAKKMDITDTMDSAGGLNFEIPNSVSVAADPPVRPNTIESPLAASALEAADDGKRTNSFYIGIGMVVGLVVLIVLALVGTLIYWFVLAKGH
jgi:hypothetical protein